MGENEMGVGGRNEVFSLRRKRGRGTEDGGSSRGATRKLQMGKVTWGRTLRGGDFRVSNRACELCLGIKLRA